jgi:hypothetical protein
MKETEMWLVVTSNEDEAKIVDNIKAQPLKLKTAVFSREDIMSEVRKQA